MAERADFGANGGAGSGNHQVAGVPTPVLSKGGGAIRGIGEKFAANPVTGTGSATVPIAVSPGRSGFGPQLSLSYDSGAGNGIFGFGWSLALPQISRKTDKGLPLYDDIAESDVFVLSGAEDLVPSDEQPDPRLGFAIKRYRPRIEGLFARIELWTREESGDVHWRSISRDNVLTIYGKDENSRIADPTDSSRIFTWLICETRDDKGNGGGTAGFGCNAGAALEVTGEGAFFRAELAAQRRRACVAQVHPVERDAPGRRLVEPPEQVERRALARAARSHQGHDLATLHLEVHVVQDGIAGVVREADLLEPHGVRERRQVAGVRPVEDRRARRGDRGGGVRGGDRRGGQLAGARGR